jgi:hypothetical protein
LDFADFGLGSLSSESSSSKEASSSSKLSASKSSSSLSCDGFGFAFPLAPDVDEAFVPAPPFLDFLMISSSEKSSSSSNYIRLNFIVNLQ